MKSEINFLDSKKIHSNRELQNNLQQVRVFTFISMSAVALVAGIMFILILSSPLQQARQQQDQANTEIQKLHPKMAKLYIANDRISDITSLLSSRPDQNQTLQTLKDQASGDISFDKVDIEDKTVTVEVLSSSLNTLDSFVQHIVTLGKNHTLFSQVKLSEIALVPDQGKYSCTMEVTHL